MITVMKKTLSFEGLNTNPEVVLSMEGSHVYICRHAFNQWIYSEKAQKRKEKGANPYEILEISNLTLFVLIRATQDRL